MSESNFLYRLTGCLDLARNEGQKKQKLPQTGTTRLDITPISKEIQATSSIKFKPRLKFSWQFLITNSQYTIKSFDQQFAISSLTHMVKTTQIPKTILESTKKFL